MLEPATWHGNAVPKSKCGARSNSLSSLGRGSCEPRAPRLSLLIRRDAGLEDPPRTSEGIDHILQTMEVAWRQVNTARGSTVKLANPEHNLLVSLECARDFMLGLLTEPDPGRQRLAEIFGGDCSRIARVRAILDGATLSHRNCTDDRISSCMSAVKSVEAVLKKDCGVGRRLSEAQQKELTRLRERQSRFQARHLRGEFSPLSKNGSPSQSRSSWFGFEAATTGSADDALPPRPRAGSEPSLRSELGRQSVSSFHQSWQALRDHWESGNLFRNPWANMSKDDGCKGTRDSSATCSRRSTLKAAEPTAGADNWSGLDLVADPTLDDADPCEAPGDQSSKEDPCISEFKNDAMLTAEAGVQPSETPSTWVEDEPDAVAVGSTDWDDTVKDGAVSTTSDTPRAQSLDKPRSFESASGKSARVHLDSLGMEDVTLESPLLGEVGEQSAEGDPGANPAPAHLDFVPSHSGVAETTAAADETGGSLSTESNDRPAPGSFKQTPECDSLQPLLPAESDADRRQVGQDVAMEAGAPNAETGQSQSESQSTWVEDEPDAVAVGSTDWDDTVKDGAVSTTSDTPRAQSLDKPRSFESASCKSTRVHLDSLGMADVTLESPLLGEVGEQSAEGDPGAIPAPAHLDFVPSHSGVAETTAAAEETGGSFSTEPDGRPAAMYCCSLKQLEVDDIAGAVDPEPVECGGPAKGVELFACEDSLPAQQPKKCIEADDSSSDEDVPMPANWGTPRQKRGSIIRPVALPAHLLQQAKDAGYSEDTGVVEFRVGRDEEKIGIAFKILPPAGHLVVEKITAGTPAEALRLPKGSRLLCINGIHTGEIEAEDFFDVMRQRPLDLLFLKPDPTD